MIIPPSDSLDVGNRRYTESGKEVPDTVDVLSTKCASSSRMRKISSDDGELDILAMHQQNVVCVLLRFLLKNN